jgi:hypothetical protein
MEDRMGLPGSLRIETVLLLFGSVMSMSHRAAALAS